MSKRCGCSSACAARRSQYSTSFTTRLWAQVEWVLQKYVEKPLLVNKKKFHLRVHVLAVGRFVVVHSSCVSRLFS
jgi:hypothetical protein